MLRINKPAKAGLRAAHDTCLGFRAGKPLKLQTANKNAAGMPGLYISGVVFMLVMFKPKWPTWEYSVSFNTYAISNLAGRPFYTYNLDRMFIMQLMLSREV